MVKITANRTTGEPVSRIKTPPNFDSTKFNSAIWNKGYDVVYEKAIKCPCELKRSGSPNPKCKNCSGSGWFYVNPTETRMVLHSMKADKRHELFSMLSDDLDVGSISVTTMYEDKLSYMDRITIVDAESEFSETMFPEIDDNGNYISFSSYKADSIYGIFLFQTVDQKLKRLTKSVDFTQSDRFFIFNQNTISSEDSKVTIRYTYAPCFLVSEIMRDSMRTRVVTGEKEVEQMMPSNYLARRAHKIDFNNISNSNKLDNSW